MSAADAPSLPTFAGFETVEKLGEGGMCAVFRVRPVGGEGGELAVKLLTDPSKTAAERFSAEARILRAIRHPNVLVVHPSLGVKSIKELVALNFDRRGDGLAP